MNSDCNISKQSLKVSKGKQPRKNKSWPTGREFKGLSLVSCSNAYKKKMGVTDTTQCTVVTNDTEWQKTKKKKAPTKNYLRPQNPGRAGEGAEMAWIHSPFMRIDKRRSKNNNYHTYATWTCTVWCTYTNEHKWDVCNFFKHYVWKEDIVQQVQSLEKSEWIPTVTFLNNHRKCQKENSPGKINPGPPGENSKD